MAKIKEVLRQRFVSNLSIRQIKERTGVPRSTISDYCKRFEIITNTIESALRMENDELQALLYPEQRRQIREIERPLPDMGYILKELHKRGVTRLLLWQEYARAKRQSTLGV